MQLEGLSGFSAWLVYCKVIHALPFLRRFNVAHNDQLAQIEKLKRCETLEEFEREAEKLNSAKFKEVFYTFEDIVEIFKNSPENAKRKMLFEALTLVNINDDELMRLLAVHKDKNGIGYSKHNIINLRTNELIPKAVETLIACSLLSCDFALMTPDEMAEIKGKKISILTEANEILGVAPQTTTGELIALAVKKVVEKVKAVRNVNT
ncbi:TPA: hypothetical protein P0E12_004991 [Vibrio harveyi]|nr:hypothetical protein [Vibrio harveyi]